LSTPPSNSVASLIAKYLYEVGIVKNTQNLGPWLNTSMQEISKNNFEELVNMIKSNQKLRYLRI
jgi:hypothetical protein